MKRILTAFALACAVFNKGQAQSYFDGFESYAVGTGPHETGGWAYDQFWPSPTPGATVRGSVGAISPYEGNRMLELRGSSVGEIAITYGPNDQPYPQLPAVEVSVHVLVASKDFVGQVFGMGFRKLDAGIHGVSFDFAKQVATTSGTRGDLPQLLPLTFDRWHQYRVRIDFNKKELRHFFDGFELESQPMRPLNDSTTFGRMSFGTRPLTDQSDKYPANVGAPGFFMDNYLVTVVPEPTSMVLYMALTISAVSKLRRKKL